MHALVVCDWAQEVWRLSKFWELSMHVINYDFWGLFKYASHELTHTDLSLFVLTLWGIWEARNKWLYENIKMVPSHVVERVKGLFQSFVCMHSISEDSEHSNGDISVERWEMPPVGWYKLNVDVVVDKVNGTVGYGAVIRNSDGVVMAVGVDQGIFSDDVDIAEAEALRFGIRLASEISLSPLVELDSLRVTQFVNGKCHTRTELFWIISEI